MIKCPYCGNHTVDKIKTSTGTTYVLTEVNTNCNPPEFLPTCGLPLEVLGCLTCKRVQFVCPSLRSN